MGIPRNFWSWGDAGPRFPPFLFAGEGLFPKNILDRFLLNFEIDETTILASHRDIIYAYGVS